ncbi:MAG: putative toxin-antitoxin system toxin component, PIN family [Porticoccaceae bacterium]
MKVLLDSNVWVSALVARGLCADLLRVALRRHGLAGFELLLSDAVRSETLRILRDKFKATEAGLDAARAVMGLAREVAQGDWQPPAAFPDPDDVVIVGAALAAGADLLVTGDKALLELGVIEGLPIIAPRAAYERLRGLA